VEDAAGLTIRSFAVVFRIERRLHRIDRFALRVPGGIPLAGLGWATAILLAVLIAQRLPALGAVIALIPAPFRLVAGPIAGAVLLQRIRVDGRSAQAHVRAWLRHRLR
jgi:hypothetical protein